MNNAILLQLMTYAPECTARGDRNALEEIFSNPATRDYLRSLVTEEAEAGFLLSATVSNCMQNAIHQGIDTETVYRFSRPYIRKACSPITREELLDAIMEVSFAFLQLHEQWNHSHGSWLSPRVKAYIQDHLTEKLRAGQIAGAMGVAESTLHIAFKRETGTTVYEAILQAKMERSMFLLQYTGISIADLAYQLGFSSQSHFTAKFRRYHGITPRQVRNAK